MSDGPDPLHLSRRQLALGAAGLAASLVTGCRGDRTLAFAGKGQGGSMRKHHVVRDRSVGVFLPKPKATKGMPLILFLHPSSHDLLSISKIIGVFKFDNTFPAVMALPNGQASMFSSTERHWNSGHINYPNPKDDVSILKDVLKDLERRYQTDPKRVYLMGTSNGGMMCYRLAAEMSGKFAGMSVHASTIGGRSGKGKPLTVNDPAKRNCKPMSLMHSHGERDEIIRLLGGNGIKSNERIDLGVRDSVAYWMKQDGIKSAMPKTLPIGKLWKSKRGRNGSRVWVNILSGVGHPWQDSVLPLSLEFFGLR